MSKDDKILDMKSECDFEKEKIDEMGGQSTSIKSDKDWNTVE